MLARNQGSSNRTGPPTLAVELEPGPEVSGARLLLQARGCFPVEVNALAAWLTDHTPAAHIIYEQSKPLAVPVATSGTHQELANSPCRKSTSCSASKVFANSGGTWMGEAGPRIAPPRPGQRAKANVLHNGSSWRMAHGQVRGQAGLIHWQKTTGERASPSWLSSGLWCPALSRCVESCQYSPSLRHAFSLISQQFDTARLQRAFCLLVTATTLPRSSDSMAIISVSMAARNHEAWLLDFLASLSMRPCLFRNATARISVARRRGS